MMVNLTSDCRNNLQLLELNCKYAYQVYASFALKLFLTMNIVNIGVYLKMMLEVLESHLMKLFVWVKIARGSRYTYSHNIENISLYAYYPSASCYSFANSPCNYA
jgi:hypothetical protein